MELLVEAGTYTVTLSGTARSYDYENIYLPDIKKEITVSDKEINMDFSYAGYVPVSFDATFGGEKLTEYVGVVTDAQGQFVAEYDYEEMFEDGEYSRFYYNPSTKLWEYWRIGDNQLLKIEEYRNEVDENLFKIPEGYEEVTMP